VRRGGLGGAEGFESELAVARASVVIEGGDGVDAGMGLPLEGLIWGGGTEEFFSGEPVEFEDIGFGLGGEGDGSMMEVVGVDGVDATVDGRGDLGRFAGARGEIEAGAWGEGWREASGEARFGEEGEEIGRPEFVDFAAEGERAVVGGDAEAGFGVDEDFAMDLASGDGGDAGDEPTCGGVWAGRGEEMA